MSKFDYASMPAKYEQFTGTKREPFSSYIVDSMKSNFPMVSLEGNKSLDANMHPIIRDWCEEHFGNNWIYDWNDFYFINQADAAWFALRWS